MDLDWPCLGRINCYNDDISCLPSRSDHSNYCITIWLLGPRPITRRLIQASQAILRRLGNEIGQMTEPRAGPGPLKASAATKANHNFDACSPAVNRYHGTLGQAQSCRPVQVLGYFPWRRATKRLKPPPTSIIPCHSRSRSRARARAGRVFFFFDAFSDPAGRYGRWRSGRCPWRSSEHVNEHLGLAAPGDAPGLICRVERHRTRQHPETGVSYGVAPKVALKFAAKHRESTSVPVSMIGRSHGTTLAKVESATRQTTLL